MFHSHHSRSWSVNGLALVMLLAAGASAAPPRVWTWGPPLDDGTTDPSTLSACAPRFIQTVRVKVITGHPTLPIEIGMTGTQAATAVCELIQARGLQAGEVAIILQDFAKGDGAPDNPFRYSVSLTTNHADGLTACGPECLVADWWMTPWMSNGIAETRAWMEEFVARYQFLQAEAAGGGGGGLEKLPVPPIPNPSRFIFDNEFEVISGSNMEEVFRLMQLESRWYTEPIPGWFAQTPTGLTPLTMEEIYDQAGRPPYPSGAGQDDPPYLNWLNWYTGVTYQAIEGAMNAAAYSVIRQAWPECMSSDYRTSCRTDNVTDETLPPYIARRYYFETKPGHHAYWQGYSDMQSPITPLVWTRHLRPNESIYDSTLRIHRATFDSLLHSFGGQNPPIVPWFNVTVYLDQLLTTADRHHQRDLLALIRSKGVEELIAWSDGNIFMDSRFTWNNLSSVIAQVWLAAVTDVSVARGVSGSTSGPPQDLLRHADADPLTLLGDGGAGQQLEVVVGFSSCLNNPARLRVSLDSVEQVIGVPDPTGIPADAVTTQVSIRDWSAGGTTPTWHSIGFTRADACGKIEAFYVEDATSYIRPTDGRIEMRVAYSSSIGGIVSVKLDHIAAIELDPSPLVPKCRLADINHDDRLNINDIAAFTLAYDAQCLKADVNHDGVVDAQDTADFYEALTADPSCWSQ